MTIPPTEPNRPTSFDFGLGNSTAADAELPTRRSTRAARVDSRSLAVPVIVTVVVLAIIGGGAFTGWKLVSDSEAAVAADSAALCADIASTPGVLDQTGFGWPIDGADPLTDMKAFQERWAALAAKSQATIRPQVAAVANAAQTLIEGAEISKSVDRQGSLAKMNEVTSRSTLPAWVNKYCG
jgi:hypothetical protein